MTRTERGEPLDEFDLRVLTDLVGIYDALDPMPAMLPDVVLFALGVQDLDAEVARLVESEAGLVGTRGEPVEQTRRVTFASEHLTVMIVLDAQSSGGVRIDGWAAPGGGLTVELRCSGQVFATECDSDGRFVFESAPAGPAQLVLTPTASADPAVLMPVVTPAINL